MTVAPLTLPIASGSTTQAAIFHLSAPARIVRHPASRPQILAVLEGSGEVSGNDGVFHPVDAGDAVYFAEGEEHETRTTDGMVALIIEGADLDPYRT